MREYRWQVLTFRTDGGPFTHYFTAGRHARIRGQRWSWRLKGGGREVIEGVITATRFSRKPRG